MAACCLLAVGVELSAPGEVDWNESYVRTHDRPYGCRILYEQLPALFPDVPLETSDRSPYVALTENDSDSLTYLFITNVFEPDEPTTEALLHSVQRGANVFVAALNYKGALADSLQLETSFPGGVLGDSTALTFTHARLRRDRPYVFRGHVGSAAFTGLDTLRTTVLGKQGQWANFVRVSVGAGFFYLHTTPRAFTNYHLLHPDRAEYVARVLSHLPVRRTRWDAHYKPVRVASTNPLRYVLGTPALRGAWYVLILGVLLFMLFESKRRQRAIPTMEPPKNDTLDFARTVGRLYYERADHADLARKKICYLEDFLRRRLRLHPAERWDDDFARRVANRSGASLDTVAALAGILRRIRGREALLPETLMLLSERIEQFYAESSVHPVRRERPSVPAPESA